MRRIGRAGFSPAGVVAVLAVACAVGGTALAGPGSGAGAAGKVEQAVKQAKQAKKKAGKALKTAKAAEKQPGPRGAQGATGAQGPKGDETPGGSPIATRITGLPMSTLTRYGTLGGRGGSLVFEAEAASLSPNADIVIGDFAVELTAAPGVSNSHTFTLRDDLGDTAPPVSCTITGTETACAAGAAPATIVARSLLTIEVDSVGTPAPAEALIGFRTGTP